MTAMFSVHNKVLTGVGQTALRSTKDLDRNQIKYGGGHYFLRSYRYYLT